MSDTVTLPRVTEKWNGVFTRVLKLVAGNAAGIVVVDGPPNKAVRKTSTGFGQT
jgi:hypothetical protein